MNKALCISSLCLAVVLCATCAATDYGIIDRLSEPTAALTSAVSGTMSPEELPEPYAAVRVETRSETTDAGETILYTYVNDSPDTVRIVSIPSLELYADGSWSEIPFCDGVGFCGTPDYIEAESRSVDWTLETDYLYGGALSPGLYRLSFDVVDEDYQKINVISTELVIDADYALTEAAPLSDGF